MTQHIKVFGQQREEPDLRALVAALLLLIDNLSEEELSHLSRQIAGQRPEAA